jgi:hypothetical protein
MPQANLRFECSRPKDVKASLDPDIENSKDSHTEIVAGDGFVEVRISADTIGRVKALFNTYASLVSMLLEADDKLLGRADCKKV